MKTGFLFLIFLCSFLLKSYSQSGSLDTSFGINGKILTNVSFNDYSKAVKINSSDEIFVGGTAYIPSVGRDNFLIVKYKLNGQIDSSFGLSGIASARSIFGSAANANALFIQPDEKILLAGTTSSFTNTKAFTLIRFLGDGKLDSSFGIFGNAASSFLPIEGEAFSTKLQNNGKIIVAGTTGSNGIYEIVLVRYNTNGSPDSSFGINGITRTSINIDKGPIGIAIQSDDKILVATTRYEGMALLRFTQNGFLDPTFSGDGVQSFMYTPGNGFHQGGASSVLIQSDQKIVISGVATDPNTGQDNIAVVRFTSSGEIDRNFGNDGIQISGSFLNETLGYSSLLQSDEKIVVGGYSKYGATRDFALTRFTKDGVVDSSFGNYGIVQTDYNNSNDYCFSIDQQSDGKIVACGYSQDIFSSETQYALARYNNNSSTVPCTTNNWSGSQSSEWENPQNWSCEQVPDSNSDVVIGTGFTVVVSSNVILKSLTIGQGSIFTIGSGYTLTVLH
ncbi:MAG TPA: hypothetical protein PLY34_19815 [Ferruginibacter sp.]|nr:hypothetical protein [Ferruginibacter sp.]HPH92857.1 hypothetical protein [Ferruginibacter sp.]